MASDALERPLQVAAMPATTRLRSTAGPARPAPIAVVTKTPVPTMAPRPKPSAPVRPMLRARTGSAIALFRLELDDRRFGLLGQVQPQEGLVRRAVTGHAGFQLPLVGGDEALLVLRLHRFGEVLERAGLQSAQDAAQVDLPAFRVLAL